MASKAQLSSREMELLGLAFQCMKDPSAVQIDTTKFAELGGFKNAKTAGTIFAAIRKKLVNAANSTPAGAATKKTATKGIAHGSNDINDGEDGTDDGGVADNEKTPVTALTKKKAAQRKPKAKVTPIKVEDDEDADSAALTAINEAEGNAADSADAEEAENATTATVETTPTKPKRKYTPRKPKDPNTPATKRTKKATSAEVATNDEQKSSIFGGSFVQNEDEAGDEADTYPQTPSQEQLALENTLMPDAV